jgi:hypothetical protein
MLLRVENSIKKSGDRNQKTEIRRQKSGDRNQETEIRRQKSEDRNLYDDIPVAGKIVERK